MQKAAKMAAFSRLYGHAPKIVSYVARAEVELYDTMEIYVPGGFADGYEVRRKLNRKPYLPCQVEEKYAGAICLVGMCMGPVEAVCWDMPRKMEDHIWSAYV